MKRLLFAALLVVLLSSCSEKEVDDKITTESISKVSPEIGTTVNPMSDAMDRGQHDLSRNVVVDVSYYKTHSVARGDIVYYEDQSVSRVVGLPSEKIKISNGQIYIDGAKLDTFYGTAHIRGYDYEHFKGSDLEEKAKENLIAEIFKKNMKEITISTNEVFVVGDDWSRSNHSTFRNLAMKDLRGKVLGVSE
ncbi:S26 family signal peptidase [Paenibacillus alba]|uniref:S26 family signal peptidase n=1 Tax=Paenibacillus alba TaxID=1197127 RepID=A0ABU6FXI5_9BACL|nr:S26 family signal peptidase [Paenibacillus alba]MEC0226625.1 S26 family signal peptidase [Paenibacillus alba]